MKTYRGLWMLLLVGFVVSCGPSSVQYHADRKSLIKTKRVNMFDLCNHKDHAIKNFCRDELGIKKAQHLFAFINDHVPEDYFDPEAPEDYFDSDANYLREFTHLRPRVEVTAIPEGPPLSGEQGKADGVESLKKIEEYPKSAPPTQQRLRLLINTSLNSAHIGDRLEKSYVFIFIPDGTRVETLEPLETKKEIVTYGTEKSKAEISTSVGASIPLPAASTISPELSHKWERSLERILQQQLAQRTVALNPQRDVLFGSLEGVEGIDPGGNLAVSVTLSLDQGHLAVVSILSLEKGKGEKDSSKWQVVEEPVMETRAITGIVVWYIQARIIDQSTSWVPDWLPFLGRLKYRVSGSETVSEGDDIVRPQVFSHIYPVTLWVNPWQLYHIVSPNAGNPNSGCQYLMLKREDGEKRRVAFKSFADALKFKNVLQGGKVEEIKKMMGGKLEIGFESLRENGKPELEMPSDMRLKVLFRPSSVQVPSIGQENACYSTQDTSF